MKAFVIAMCLLLAGSALAQSETKLKAIKSAQEAADKPHNLASGIHKRELDPGGGAAGGAAKEAKPKPTPDDK